MLSDAQIELAFRDACNTWPAIELSRERFASHARDADASEDGLRAWPGDFLLACAAGDGNARALRVIDERYIARLPRRIRRLGSAADAIPDILQLVRARLFSGPAPRIRAYNATAPLEQWIKVIAIRTAIDVHRQEPRTIIDGAIADAFGYTESDAGTALMKREHKRELEGAIARLFVKLSPRDRTVLRLHVLQGMSVEKIAKAYCVHRVTVARWIWNAGEIVLDGLRRHFAEQLGIVPTEFDSLARLMRSQLSLDLGRLLHD